ncbi:MAG: hypothetical protein PVG91_11100 [Gammaproteobacteria bacterium]|jgi:hypothetical protein
MATRTGHPPAAALALTLNQWDRQTLLLVKGGVMVLPLVRHMVMPCLTDLL